MQPPRPPTAATRSAAPAAAAPAAKSAAPSAAAAKPSAAAAKPSSSSSAAPSAPPVGPATPGTKIEDLFEFGGPTGNKSNFDNLDPNFKSKITDVAKAYIQAGGSKIKLASAQRGQEDQERIYKTWKDAGGNLETKPDAGGVITPALPVSLGGVPTAHNLGYAIDAGQQAEDINSKIKLADYGLRWGGTFRKADPVHIQMAGFIPGADNSALASSDKKSSSASPSGNDIVQMGESVKVGNQLRVGGSPAWRTNNPGNVGYGDIAKQFGAIGTWKNPDGDQQQKTTGIAIMPDEDAGAKMKMRLWNTSAYQSKTLEDGIHYWVSGTLGLPNKEGIREKPAVPGYVKELIEAAGAKKDTLVSSLSQDQLVTMAKAQRKWEGWHPGKTESIQAMDGGIVNGPMSGFPATLHGNEIITPLSPNSILEQLGKTSASSAGAQSMMNNSNNNDILNELFNMMSNKLDTMITHLDNGNDLSKKIAKAMA